MGEMSPADPRRGGMWRRHQTWLRPAAVVALLAVVAAGWELVDADEAPRPAARVRWPPPELTDARLIEVPEEGGSFELEDGEDYEVRLPDDPVSGPVTLVGGQDLVVIGGEIVISRDEDVALDVRDFSGTAHVEGLLIDPGGARGLEADAIRVNSRHEGSTAQLQNIYVERVGGTYEGKHGDIVQSWGGPERLRIDRLTGHTDYQGFFLATEHFDWAPNGEEISMSNIDLHGIDDGSFYQLYIVSGQGEPPLGDPPDVDQWNLWGEVGGSEELDDLANDRFDLERARGVRLGWANGVDGETFVDRRSVGVGYVPSGYR